MATPQANHYTDIVQRIEFHQNIVKFRQFMYSLSIPVRQHVFNLCIEYITNQDSQVGITATEHQRLRNLLTHFNWNEFENQSTRWWNTLSTTFEHSISLQKLMAMWSTSDLNITREYTDIETEGQR